MKSITLCLLVLVSASCLFSTNAKTTELDFNDFESFAELEALLDSQDDYVEIGEFGFIISCAKVLKKALKSLRGVNCIIKEVTNILTAATAYVDAVDACTTSQVPKDVLAIVNSCKTIITMCNNIIHLKSTMCSAENSSTNSMSSVKCFKNLFKSVMTLTRKLNTTIKQCTKFPGNTSTCYVDATTKVKTSFNNFLPLINTCIDNM